MAPNAHGYRTYMEYRRRRRQTPEPVDANGYSPGDYRYVPPVQLARLARLELPVELVELARDPISGYTAAEAQIIVMRIASVRGGN
jgi:hypothetical protein